LLSYQLLTNGPPGRAFDHGSQRLKWFIRGVEADAVLGAGDPYVALGVDRDASPDVIRAAYERRLQAAAKAGDLVGAQRVDSAYEVLRNATRRAMFDRTGIAPRPDRLPPDQRFV